MVRSRGCTREAVRRVIVFRRIDQPQSRLTHPVALSALVAVLKGQVDGDGSDAHRAKLALYEEDVADGKSAKATAELYPR